jgi:hypothetical protein
MSHGAVNFNGSSVHFCPEPVSGRAGNRQSTALHFGTRVSTRVAVHDDGPTRHPAANSVNVAKIPDEAKLRNWPRMRINATKQAQFVPAIAVQDWQVMQLVEGEHLEPFGKEALEIAGGGQRLTQAQGEHASTSRLVGIQLVQVQQMRTELSSVISGCDEANARLLAGCIDHLLHGLAHGFERQTIDDDFVGGVDRRW